MTYILTWSGASDGVTWTTAGNWIDEGTGTAHVASPATGDTCYINSGSNWISAGLSNAGVTLAALYVGPGFTGKIGSDSAPLEIASALVNYNGSGAYAKFKAGTAGITRFKVQGTGYGACLLSGGTTTTLELGKSGLLTVEAAAIVTNFYQSGGNASFGYNATAITDCRVGNGVCDTSRNVATSTTAGPSTLLRFSKTATASTLVNVLGGARVNFANTSAITINNLVASTGSTVDAVGSQRTITVTNSTLDTGSKVFKAENVSVVYTNASVIRGAEVVD